MVNHAEEVCTTCREASRGHQKVSISILNKTAPASSISAIAKVPSFPEFSSVCSKIGFLILLSFVLATLVAADDCDQIILSKENGPREGSFEAPQIVNPQNHSRQCLYTIIGREGERVQVQFKRFKLRGTPPECHHEYLDIYTEINDPDPQKINLLNTSFGGRYCGRIPPRLRVSLHSVVVVGFYTDYTNTTASLFKANYKFINGSKYKVGTSGAEDDCGYIIHSEMKKDGVFMSPTYPGVYPKGLKCYWKFVGRKGQRIRLEFRDFDLFFAGHHCPFDQIKMYDGPDQMSPLIGTYCGQQRHLIIFSSESSMMVTFTTLQRSADTQNRGFQGIFNFSGSYINLEFINKSEAEHIRGTECDQKILSRAESNGTIFSPNYPFPYLPNVVCRYFIYGLQDAQNLERVRLQFLDQFHIPTVPDGDTNCSDGYLRLYLRGQEVENKYNNPDYELCGKELPPPVVSLGPRLLIVFNSGTSQGFTFKANYKYETDYQIPGTPSPHGECLFNYYSSSQKAGTFNSPRHPANYPSNTTCHFYFRPSVNEQVNLVFDQFKVRDEAGEQHCSADYVEIYNLYRPKNNSKTEVATLNGRYCGSAIPGPIESNRDAMGLKVKLRTDHEGVYSGFDADYSFREKKDLFQDCGGNVTDREWGEIFSPNYPSKYGGPNRDGGSFTCNWFIYVKPNNSILLWFKSFAVEGNPADRGCPAAVVRIWRSLDEMPIELCGESLPKESSQLISASNSLRLSFTTAVKAVGAKGFHAVWTEIRSDKKCNGFLCKKNNYCISRNLQCNDIGNCGAEDSSDEIGCKRVSEVNAFMLFAVGIGTSSFLVIVICVWCHWRKVQKRAVNSLPRHSHVCERGARFANMDSTDRNLSPVLGTRKPHHISCSSLRTETVV